jgi:hypothetical protein
MALDPAQRLISFVASRNFRIVILGFVELGRRNVREIKICRPIACPLHCGPAINELDTAFGLQMCGCAL